MITRSVREAYDGSWRIVLFDADDQGKLTAELTRSSFDADIDSYYVQRERELERLRARLVAGELSPVGFYVEWSRMTLEDVAARMGLRKGQVRAHLTPAGFAKVEVGVLQKYARLFDIAVSDFFLFLHLEDGVEVESERLHGGLLQTLRVVSSAAAAATAEPRPR